MMGEAKFPLPGDTVAARDLKAGDAIALNGQPCVIEAAGYANGKDGEPSRYVGPIPGIPKSAIAMKLTIKDRVHFVHPGHEFILIRRTNHHQKPTFLSRWFASRAG